MASRLTFAPRAGVLRQLRAEVRKVAATFGANDKVGENLALVVDEIVNNAIEHGAEYRRRGLDLAVEITAEGDRLRVDFFDPEMPAAVVDELSRLLEQATSGMPSLDSERGRGLFLLTVYLQDLHAATASSGGLQLGGFIERK